MATTRNHTQATAIFQPRHLGLALAVFISLSLCACSLLDYAKQAKAVDTAVTLSGSVERDIDEAGQIYLQHYVKQGTQVVHFGQVPVRADNQFFLISHPGELFLIAYIDSNGNQQYDAGEPVSDSNNADNEVTIMELQPSERLTDLAITISGRSVVNFEAQHSAPTTKINQNLGRVVGLDDPMFAQANAEMGLWRPIDFIYQYGGGLLFLQEYEPDKTPVIFIHGIGASPVEFAQAIEALDRSRYQPWVFYYSSGFRLDAISDYLANALDQLQARHQFADVAIVAHSMGGLMCRSFLMKHEAGAHRYRISKYITINSPLNGLESARTGVARSPIVVPSWRDAASNSEYVKRVHGWNMPESIDYRLIFSYLKGQDGDGVVSMTSQLSEQLQNEARRIYGFNAQHTALLETPEFTALLNRILAE